MKTRLHRTRRNHDGEQVDDMDDVNETDAVDEIDDGVLDRVLDRMGRQEADDDDVTVRYAARDLDDRQSADSVRTDDAADPAVDDGWDNMLDELDEVGVEPVGLDPTGPSTTTIDHQPGLARNPAVEALWFRLSNPDFVTTAIVPVPSVTSTEANETALELARVGASITGESVNVVTAVGLRPGEAAETSRNIAGARTGQNLVVVESPSVDPSSIPILRSCPRVVLLVGLERSRGDALAGITDLIGAERVVGSVCLERATKRRWWHLLRR